MPLVKVKAPFTLPKLPYADDALAPVVSANTISFHYAKHHATYIKVLNELIAGTPYEALTMDEIVVRSAADKDPAAKKIFNNAAQSWNHEFYWHSMTPKGGAPTGKVKEGLEKAFGGLDGFKKAFTAAAVGQAGQGRRRLPQDRDDGECRHAAGPWRQAAAGRRRLGARLLPRLPEPPPRPHCGVARQAGELVVRRGKLRRLRRAQ